MKEGRLFTLHPSLFTLLLVPALALGTFLRLSGLATPSLWLDEIIAYDLATAASRQPWWRWLTGLDVEQGPLYYATELAGRLSPTPDLSMRLAPALFGIATIVVAWMAARQLRAQASVTATVFALLLACSPLAVYYSREARPYALLTLLTTGMIGLLLRASSIRLIAVTLLLAMLTSAGAAPLLMATAITAGAVSLFERDGARRRFYGLSAAAAVIATGLTALHYGASPRISAASVFHFNAPLLRQLVHSFSVAALDTSQTHRTPFVVLLFVIIGAIALIRRDRSQGATVLGMAILPAVISLIALWRLHHWYSVRYVLTSLPGYLLLASFGIVATVDALADWGALAVQAARNRMRVDGSPLADPDHTEPSDTRGNRLRPAGIHHTVTLLFGLIATVFIIRDGWTAARTEPFRKANWRTFAATVWHHAHDGDVLLTSNQWSYICLGFYLDRLPPRVRLMNASEYVEGAVSVVSRSERTWIVTGGFHVSGDIVSWACRYPIVLASPIESVRLHYAPGLWDLLLHRATPADQRAFSAGFGSRFTLDFGPDENPFLTSGWYDAEGSAGQFTRWTGRTASLLVPVSGGIDRVIDIHAAPISYPGAPPQIVSLAINGAPLSRFALADGWNDYTVNAPRDRWREGINVISFAFSRAAAPSSLSASASDPRVLGVNFERLTIRPAATPAGPGLTAKPPVTFRINEVDSRGEVTYLDANTPPESPSHETHWNHEALATILGRLGYDPQSAIPNIEQGKIRLDDLAVSVANDADCLSDLDFLRAAYSTLLGRGIDSVGQRYLLDVLRRNKNREKVVRSIVDSEELRRQLR